MFGNDADLNTQTQKKKEHFVVALEGGSNWSEKTRDRGVDDNLHHKCKKQERLRKVSLLVLIFEMAENKKKAIDE